MPAMSAEHACVAQAVLVGRLGLVRRVAREEHDLVVRRVVGEIY
jgi:hypothetical protein